MNNKRFPANNKKLKELSKSELSFLTDKKADGELYAYLQSISTPGEKIGSTKDGKGIYNAKVKKKDMLS